MQGVKCIIITLFLIVLSFGAGAHLHSFTHLKTETVSENDQFIVLKVRWTMDGVTSAGLLYDTGNARPGDEIQKKLTTEVMANVLGQHYSIEMWHDGKKVKFKDRPTEYGMGRGEYQAALMFALPLAEAQPLSGQKCTPSIFDPTYCVDMSYDEDSDVRLGQAISQKCHISVHMPTPSEQTLGFAQSPNKEDAPSEDMELGKQLARTVML